jgi:hypothetical protein
LFKIAENRRHDQVSSAIYRTRIVSNIKSATNLAEALILLVRYISHYFSILLACPQQMVPLKIPWGFILGLLLSSGAYGTVEFDRVCPRLDQQQELIDSSYVTFHCGASWNPLTSMEARTNTPEQCARICTQDPACYGTVWDSTNNNCWKSTRADGYSISVPGSVFLQPGERGGETPGEEEPTCEDVRQQCEAEKTEMAGEKQQCESARQTCENQQLSNRDEIGAWIQMVSDAMICVQGTTMTRTAGTVTFKLLCGKGFGVGEQEVISRTRATLDQCLDTCVGERQCQGVNYWYDTDPNRLNCVMIKQWIADPNSKGGERFIGALASQKRE